MPVLADLTSRFDAVLGKSRMQVITGPGQLVYYDNNGSDYTYWLHKRHIHSLIAAPNFGPIEEGFQTRANVGCHTTEFACDFSGVDCERNEFDDCSDVQARLRRIAAMLLLATGDTKRAALAQQAASQLAAVEAQVRARLARDASGQYTGELGWPDGAPDPDYANLYFADINSGELLKKAV